MRIPCLYVGLFAAFFYVVGNELAYAQASFGNSESARQEEAEAARSRLRRLAVQADVEALEPKLEQMGELAGLRPADRHKQLAVEWVNLAAAVSEAGQPEKARRYAQKAVGALDKLEQESAARAMPVEELAAMK
jgi:hypothetical protein